MSIGQSLSILTPVNSRVQRELETGRKTRTKSNTHTQRKRKQDTHTHMNMANNKQQTKQTSLVKVREPRELTLAFGQ